MKRVNAESLGDVLRRAIEEANLADTLEEYRACALWPEIVGPDIAARTGKPYIIRGVMSVSVKAAPLRHELMMSRSQLIRCLNAPFKRTVVRDIRFTG